MTQFFMKVPSDFFRIPESRYFRQSAASEVYYFLLDMAYRSEEPFFGNKAHMPSVLMSDAWKKGKLTCFMTVSMIEKYRGLSKNTVKDALRKLHEMQLILVDNLEIGQEPYHKDGMLYVLGYRIRNPTTKKLTTATETFLDKLDYKANWSEGAAKVQKYLIAHLKPGAVPMNINNIRFDGVTTQTVRESKKNYATEESLLV